MNQNTTAEIITIGDEILYGQTLDTNSHWISGELDKNGFKVIRRTAIGDSSEAIKSALTAAEKQADIILITGGLGPTKDDITKQTLATYFDSGMAINEEALADVTEFLRSRGRMEVNELNRLQAMQPLKAQYIRNTVGTAPGMWFEKNGKVFVSMPGVPSEMRTMITKTVMPKLIAKFGSPVIYHKIIRTFGIPEADLALKLAEWEEQLPPQIKLAYLPSIGQVKLRLTSTGSSLDELETLTALEVKRLDARIGNYIFAYEDIELEEVVGRLLSQHGKTLASAESCSGGLIGTYITRVPGCSKYFNGGVTAYQTAMKINILGVKGETIEKEGVVSEATVREMAENVRTLFGADIGVSTSGIAGPPSPNDEQPVGTIWIAYSDAQQTVARKLQLSADRDRNIILTTLHVLNLVRQTIQANA